MVQTKAVGLNPVDYKMPPALFKGKPVGMEMAGVVTEVGPEVTSFAVGDRVFGSKSGTMTEFGVYDTKSIAKIPEELSFVKAASMPIAYLTAYQGFKNHGFTEGMKTLVIGASGGTGIAGVHVAKALKAGEIIGVCSGQNKDFVLGLGADKVIDYKTQHVLQVLGKKAVDFLYDCASGSGAGEDYFTDGKKVLKPGPEKGQGYYVTLNSPSPVKSILLKGLGLQGSKFDWIFTSHSGKDLEEILKLMKPEGSEALSFEPVIASVVPFSEDGINSGYDMLKSRRTVGKVVVEFP